ncbi:MAG: hypothetical protein LBK13_02840 [Spirochaetales bacterium]|jgi:hypothetical protein|nr:hypothetical protein [Spirochaetales bacterium]
MVVSDRYELYRGFNTSVIQQYGRIKNRPKGRDWSQFCFRKIAARPCSLGIKPACRNKAFQLFFFDLFDFALKIRLFPATRAA